MKIIKLSLIILSVTFLYFEKSHAVGSGAIANEVTSVEGLSNLLGVTGSKTDPMVVYNNPASIIGQGKVNGSVGASFFKISAKRDGNNNTSDTMKTGNIVIPNFGVTQNSSSGKFGWGLAVLSPYGLSTEWEESSNVRYVATKSSLKMMDISPAVAFRPHDQLAFGFGLDYFNTFDTDLQKKAPVDVINFLLGFPTAGAGDANSKLTGDGSQWGYHTGLIYTPTNTHTFGLTYHSEVKTEIEGELELTNLSGASAVVFGGTNFKTQAKTDLFYPQNIQLGYKYSKEDRWEAGFNLAWYDWSSNKELKITLPNATATQQAIAATTTPLNWRDVWSATIGGFYRFTENWKLNGGVYFIPAVYPESTFSPAVPDMDKYGFSIGPSYKSGNFTVEAVYNPLFYSSRSVSNSLGQNATGLASADISGKYDAMIHIIGLNIKLLY